MKGTGVLAGSFVKNPWEVQGYCFEGVAWNFLNSKSRQKFLNNTLTDAGSFRLNTVKVT